MKRSENGFSKLLDNLTGPIPKPKTTKTFRHEFKYLINRYDYLKCRNLCERYMNYDKFAGADGTYFINSLYFDSVGCKDFLTKTLVHTTARKCVSETTVTTLIGRISR